MDHNIETRLISILEKFEKHIPPDDAPIIVWGTPRRVWSAEMDSTLLTMVAKKSSHIEIGQRLGMSLQSVKWRSRVLRRRALPHVV
jgi:hypothetical protein